MNTETWENFIQELRLYFTWNEISDITNTMLNNLEMLQDYTNKKEITDAILDGLRQGL